MPLTNSAVVTFPQGVRVLVQSFANAGFMQTITIQPPSGQPAVFTGNGEGNIPLKLTTPGFLSGGGAGWPSFNAVSGNYIVSVKANNQPTPVVAVQSQMTTPTGGTAYIAQVSSEDSTDQDWNDTLTLFTAAKR